LAGLLAAFSALAMAQLVAAFINDAAAPVVVVGGVAIDSTPEWLKAFAINNFGTHDKQVLVGGILATLAVYAAVAGVLAFRHLLLGVAAVAGFGVLGVLAGLSRPESRLSWALPSLLGALAGVGALVVMVRLSRRTTVAEPEPDDPGPLDGPWNRRGFLLGGLGVGAAAVATGGLGKALVAGADVEASRNDVRLPVPADAAEPLTAGTSLGVAGISRFTTTNADFYRVDTALVLPKVRAETWRLKVHGMVEREVTLTWDQLLRKPLIERDITLTCVSNQVGGKYAGNARWLGYPLKDLLEEAGIKPGADQLVSRSKDGWTAGTPISVAMDGRDAMLAIGMNGEPLPVRHGFPVRMLVPGLYGMVSATKWLVDLEVTTYDAFDAYWVRRGWATDAVIRTMARIDTPRPLANVSGTVAIGGVAWAQHRGIKRAEVRVDDGDWQVAELGDAPTQDTWRQWSLPWQPTAGRHTIVARATDETGVTQPETRKDPFPSGATGWHSVVVTAS
jgi:DMSO/TMAO reductase YedYZ molybdopterin-dependent catalytic subunit